MSAEEIDDALQEFQGAIASDEYHVAEDVLNDLSDLYGRVESDEMTTVQRVRTAMAEGPVSGEQRETVQQYLGQKVATNLARSGILSGGKMYLLDPYNHDESNIVDSVDQLRDHEEKMRVDEEGTREILSEVDIPATVSILGISEPDKPFVVGTPMSIDVTVQNAGGEVASGVELTCEAQLDVSPSSRPIGDLEGGAERTTSFELVGEEGEYTVEFAVDSDDAGSDFKEIDLSVAGKRSSAEMAAETIAETRTLVSSNESLDDGWRTALHASLDSAASSVDRAFQYLDGESGGTNQGVATNDDHPGRGPPDDTPGRGPPDDTSGRGPPDGPGRGPTGETHANNALSTAINQIGAFLNKVADFWDESNGNDVAESFWFTLEKRAELAIDQLDRARRAEGDANDSDSSDGDDDDSGDRPGRGPRNDDQRRGPPNKDDDRTGRGPVDDEGDDQSSQSSPKKDDEDHPGRGPSRGADGDDDENSGRGPPDDGDNAGGGSSNGNGNR